MRVVAVVAGVACVAVTLLYGVTRGSWVEGLLNGLATAMALLPEEFPVVLTVFLALGAHRISRVGVLTRRMSAIERLGAATVLCTDKTGTLTENRMVVRTLWTPQAECRLPRDPTELDDAMHNVLEHALLASPVAPTDPMEVALHALGQGALGNTEHLHPGWDLRHEYPLSPEMLAMTRAWTTAEGEPVEEVSAKGSPEAIFDLCHLDAAQTVAMSQVVTRLAGDGLRVLGVAHARVEDHQLPATQHEFEFEFDGLVAFEDPLRDGIPAAIARCQAAGVRVLMITGDYPVTAASIARAAGLADSEPLTGAELATLDDRALTERLRTTHVAARIVPEDKLRIVQVLQAAGETVVMTGDGVNDAPALTAADIGVAMGSRGTEVAREAAALVLIDDDFDSLVAAMAQGRRIFANLRKSMSYIVAIHVPIAGLAVIPILIGWEPALLPVHIVLLELVIDPACSLVYEAEPAEADAMRQPPRAPETPLISRPVLVHSVLQGLVVLGATLGVLAWGRSLDLEPDGARSLAFATLMAANVGLILANRSANDSALVVLRRPNPVFGWVAGGAILVAPAVMYVPRLNHLLHFVAVPVSSLLVALAVGFASLVAVEIGKAALGTAGAISLTSTS